jgi:hypothetical protein
MKLEEMKIERKKWGVDAGKVVGEIKFAGAHGNITLQLTEEHCQSILQVCAGALVESARQSADQLTEAISVAATPMITMDATAV